MAIISEFQEEDAKPSTASLPSPPKAVPFNAILEPSDPAGFLDKVFDFLAKESDFIREENVDKEVAAIVRAAKERSKKVEEVVPKVEIKEDMKKEKEIKEEVKREPMEVDKKEEDSSSGLKVPNKGNGLDLEKYSWTQTLQEVTVNVPVPSGTKSRFVVCEIKKNHLKVGFKGQPPIIDGELFQAVKPDDCYWSIGMLSQRKI